MLKLLKTEPEKVRNTNIFCIVCEFSDNSSGSATSLQFTLGLSYGCVSDTCPQMDYSI